ncbi:MAG: hypothetical protein H6Q86_3156 [candidate division NC10 bacterium]|nr:hypothetical protein [candidate division NC10 bacterium]
MTAGPADAHVPSVDAEAHQKGFVHLDEPQQGLQAIVGLNLDPGCPRPEIDGDPVRLGVAQRGEHSLS